jgi:hypothetical protein
MTKHSPLSPASARTHSLPAVQPEPESPPPPALLPDTAIVPVTQRPDGWTPARQRLFIETLADTGSVAAAARAVGMSEQSARRLRRRADARAFDAAWEGALERAMQQLLPTAIDRALNGTVRQRWHRGELIGEERVYHDGLLLHLLERGERTLGAERARRALRENWEGHMDALEAGAPEPAMPATGPLRPEPGEWRVAILGDRWITNAPWPLDTQENLSVPKHRGPPPGGDWRYVTQEENDALNRRLSGRDHAQEQARRCFFELGGAGGPAENKKGPTPELSELSKENYAPG